MFNTYSTVTKGFSKTRALRRDGRYYEATLGDGLMWTCSNGLLQDALNFAFGPSPYHSPASGNVHATLFYGAVKAYKACVRL